VHKQRAKKRGAGRLRVATVLALATTSLVLVALPGQALATNPCSDVTDAQYGKTTDQCLASGLAGDVGGGGPAERVAVPSSSESLPFTGLDVAALAAVALALTGTGVALRRLATIGATER
jgi:hypothetical protein